ncbi:hypothetical protein [Colletotrichum camelliae filamentous virus 1]|uniref:Uncharacterized protein n=1 Tax=Colletotrichum camelliae filamentous virus 1 TaxID=2029458 RepID=A0A286M3N6_9VIRU|nr:hypothetical protein QK579_s8gp1 [Colletotrichum camelliae filamentous virus 1]ASV63100.1 hypothetical protein [Colletotrichum camelliae filamentous virus 1]
MMSAFLHAGSSRGDRLELDEVEDRDSFGASLLANFGVDVRVRFGSDYHVMTLGAPAAHGRFFDVGDMTYGISIYAPVDWTLRDMGAELDQGGVVKVWVWAGRTGNLCEVALRRANMDRPGESPRYTDMLNLVSSPDPLLVLMYSTVIRSASGRCLYSYLRYDAQGGRNRHPPLPEIAAFNHADKVECLVGQTVAPSGKDFPE